jgi:PAS domain S-box-containing protein
MLHKHYESILLELTFSMAGESEVEALLQNCLPIFLRKLNCLHVALLKRSDSSYTVSKVIPQMVGEQKEFRAFLSSISEAHLPDRDHFLCLKQPGVTYYVYDLNGYGLLILGRRSDMDRLLAHELLALAFHFGRVLQLAENLELQAEEERKLKEVNSKLALLESMIEYSRDAIHVANAAGEVVYMNHAAEALLGADSSQGKPLYVGDFEPLFKDRDDWKKHLEELKAQQRLTVESRLINQSNKLEIDVELTVSARELEGDYYVIVITRDISERKKNEAQLLETSDTLHSVVSALPDAILKIDNERRFNYCKANGVPLLHKEREVIGKHIDELLPPQLAERVHVAIDQCRERREQVRIEYELTINGQEYWFEARINSVNEQEVLFIIRDVTERMRSSIEVERKERMLGAIAKSTSALLTGNNVLASINRSLVWLGEAASVDRTYLFENNHDEGVTLTSQRFEWARGGVSPQIDNPELKDVPLFGEFLSIAERGEPWKAIIRQLPDDHEMKEILAAQEILSVLLIPIIVHGRYWGFVGFDDCTTERTWSESELSLLQSFASSIASALERKESSQRLEEMARFPLENPRPTMRIDMNGNILMRNDAARSIAQIVYEETHHTLESFCKALVCNIPSGALEFTCEIEADDRSLLIEVRLSSQEREMNLYSSDITELKRAQKALIEAKEMAESASDSKSNFLANMSHEIRTPLNSIIGFSDLLARSELSTQQRAYLNSVKVSGNILLDTINDILDLSKIESGNLEIEQARMSLAELLEQLAEVVTQKAQQQGIKLYFDVDPETPAWFSADMVRLRQVIINLLGNAVKFTEQGSVTLSVNYLTELENGEALISFKVTDTGAGITPEQQERIFSPFSQADASITRRFGGTGLGLAISSRLLELMGTAFELESEVGVGSAFSFTLKVKEAEGQLIEPFIDRPSVVMNITDDRVTEGLQRQMNAMRVQYATFEKQPLSSGEVLLIDHAARASMSDAEYTSVIREARHTIIVSEDPPSALREGEKWLRHPINPVHFKRTLQGLNGFSDLPSEELTLEHSEVSILIVDDNKMNLILAEDLVKRFLPNATVAMASGGKEAVDKAAELFYDIILMDIQMPEMSGYEASERIRQSEETNHSQIIALTAGIMKEDRQRCVDAGMDDFVSKPIRMAELRKALHEALERQVATSR